MIFFLGISNIEYRSAPILHSVEFDDVIVFIIGQSGPIRMQLQSFSATYAILLYNYCLQSSFQSTAPSHWLTNDHPLTGPFFSFSCPAITRLRNNDVTIMTHLRIGRSPHVTCT